MTTLFEMFMVTIMSLTAVLVMILIGSWCVQGILTARIEILSAKEELKRRKQC